MSVEIGTQYLRQLGIYNPADHEDDAVTFIGVGGIGSFAAMGAAKLGLPGITLYDHDEVEAHNQPNQFYGLLDLDNPKVEAMHDHILRDRGEHGNVTMHNMQVDGTTDLRGVVVSGLDSMEARTSVWEAIKLNPAVPLYLDARIGGPVIVVYAVDPNDFDDIASYEKTLHTDEEGEDAPCTERGIIDVGLQVGAILTRALRRHFTGQDIDRITLFNQNTLTATKGGWVE